MKKPTCNLYGVDSNIFAIIGRVSACLKKAGLKKQAQNFKTEILKSKNYDMALLKCSEFVNIIYK